MSKKINCPHCGTQADFGGGEPYCGDCGWRRARVENELREAAKLDPVVVPLAVAALGLIVWVAHGDLKVAGLMLCLFVAFFGVAAIWPAYQLRKLKAHPAREVLRQRAGAERQDLGMPLEPYRAVRLRQQTRNMFVLAAFLSMFPLILFSFAAVTLAGRLLLIFTCVVILAATLWTVRSVRRAKHLTAEGAVAPACITRAWTIRGKGGRHMIEYEFLDSAGQVIRKQSRDSTYTLYEDMTVPVFYDPQDARDHLLAPLSYFEVIDAKGKSR